MIAVAMQSKPQKKWTLQDRFVFGWTLGRTSNRQREGQRERGSVAGLHLIKDSARS
jgi:hypothetical protein